MPQDVFRITTAGSVDDGKSTLIARLLLDIHSIPEDQLDATLGANADPSKIADLLDGLESEKEQGITIDVAHRYFDSDTRRYHLSDSPGHEQYTRNMATASAAADAVVLVIDSSAGIKPQTIRHLDIAHRLGIKQFLVVANKIDLVGYSRKTFEALREDVTALFEPYDKASWGLIPASGTLGDGVVRAGRNMRWYQGPTLLQALDALQPVVTEDAATTLSLQLVQRQGPRKRRYFASVLSGSVSEGDSLTVIPGNTQATVTHLHTQGRPSSQAHVGEQVSFEVSEDRDIERGSLLSTGSNITISHEWNANLIWLESQSGITGRPYLLRCANQQTRVTITKAHLEDASHNKMGETPSLETNNSYQATLSAQSDIAMAPFEVFPALGRFVLINPETGHTAAVGTVNYSLRRSENVHPHSFAVNRGDREGLMGGKGQVLWFTGLSGSGKSTIADQLSQRLQKLGRMHTILDGDSLRTGLNKDLGFTEADRVENIRRTAEVAKLMAEAGLVVLVCLISPYRQDRNNARDIIGADRFSEIHVATDLAVCEDRDPKGLYAKARSGAIPNFTGINAPYEEPLDPALVLDGAGSLEDSVSQGLSLITN
ncbi:MAG: adenylyl-sulfate kinase [Microbacteriaceae bacterium]|nr:adenylyl-sulfate kinase [Microbacteriaceae bacterium]